MRRLAAVVRTLPSRAPGLEWESSRLHVWRNCGGPIDEVPALLEVLLRAELIEKQQGYIRLSAAGQRIRTRSSPEGPRQLSLALLRAGYFFDQARRLLDMGTVAADGSLTCNAGNARRSSPQLVGVLQYWPSVIVQPNLRVPVELLHELEAVWSLLPPAIPDDNGADVIRKSIGNRGELYSYQFERLRAIVASNIVWVARDDDDLGFDIEDRTTPRRRIEVKASGDRVVRFLMSTNEWARAQEDPDRYEIHFWGGLDLNVTPSEEFTKLRSSGFPRIFLNFAAAISNGQLVAVPAKWLVTEPSPPT
jgi:uncharacterized protein DUF3883